MHRLYCFIVYRDNPITAVVSSLSHNEEDNPVNYQVAISYVDLAKPGGQPAVHFHGIVPKLFVVCGSYRGDQEAP